MSDPRDIIYVHAEVPSSDGVRVFYEIPAVVAGVVRLAAPDAPFVDALVRRMTMDGSRITPGTEGCRCDTGSRRCEMPCWQRIGLTSSPCCSDCAPLPEVEDE